MIVVELHEPLYLLHCIQSHSSDSSPISSTVSKPQAWLFKNGSTVSACDEPLRLLLLPWLTAQICMLFRNCECDYQRRKKYCGENMPCSIVFTPSMVSKYGFSSVGEFERVRPNDEPDSRAEPREGIFGRQRRRSK
jgi:hypothetical protein